MYLLKQKVTVKKIITSDYVEGKVTTTIDDPVTMENSDN